VLARACSQRKDEENTKKPQSASHQVELQLRKGKAVPVHPIKGYGLGI